MPRKLPARPREDQHSTYEDFLRSEVQWGIQQELVLCENLPPGMLNEETTHALVSILEAAKGLVKIMGVAAPSKKSIADAKDRVARAYATLLSIERKLG